MALFGAQGIVNTVLMDLFGLDSPPVKITNSLTIIFMAHAFYNYAIVVRIVSALWANLDPSLEETAKVLGAGRIRVFYHVTLPLLLPAIVSSALLAFAFSFTSFGVVLILGGSQFATLEVAIYELTAKLFRLPLSGALSVIQLVFTYAFLLLYARFQERSTVSVNLKPREATVHRRMRAGDRLFVLGMGVFLIALLSPLIALVVRSITFEGGGVRHRPGRQPLLQRERVIFLPVAVEYHMEFPSVCPCYRGDILGPGYHRDVLPIRPEKTGA